jgi:hypothetical protein
MTESKIFRQSLIQQELQGLHGGDVAAIRYFWAK